MNVLKKIIIICACIAMLSVNLDVVTAEASTYVGKVYNKEGGFLGIGATKYTYKLYYEGNCDIAIVSPNKLLTYVNKHTYNTTPKTVYGNEENAYTYSTTISFNNSTGANIGIEGLVELSSEKGYGVETGFGYTKSYVKGVELCPDRYDKTGYYVIAGGATCKKMFWQKYLGSKKLDSEKGNFYMPYGGRVVYTMYSTDNSNWKFYS